MFLDSHHSKTRLKEFEKVVHFGDTVQVRFTSLCIASFGGILRCSKYIPWKAFMCLVPHFIHVSLNVTAMVGQLCVVCVVTSMTGCVCVIA